MNILLVDDDDLILDMVSNVLTRAGLQVRTAANGREALEVLEQGDHRLVITDWQMPEMTGIELCEAIRHGDFPGYVYVILLTSRDTTEEIVTGLAAGADDFIKKPFNPSELIGRVRTGERVLSLETRDVAIFAMAKLAESRDPETGAHLERVRSYSRVLAQYLATQPGFSEIIDGEFIRLIYSTSPLHDIGKVGIPDSVLLKPGLLTASEYEIMKTHTLLGAQTLDAALTNFPHAKYLQMARDIAATHHERYDGSGYPFGLSGDKIPLSGRIVALADVYDALTSKRVYKDASSHEMARSIIVQESGKQFDPQVVDAFLACEDQFGEIRRRYAERHESASLRGLLTGQAALTTTPPCNINVSAL